MPTGNFGDVFAGYVAAQMGLPVARLIVATNENDILDRALTTGRYETRGVVPPTSPSMDIQVSSNFERLIFEALDRDDATTTRLMQTLSQSGGFALPETALARMRAGFGSSRIDQADVAATIRRTLDETGELLDPHSAVGYAAARRHAGPEAMVTLATAHPAKFPAAVEQAAGIHPAFAGAPCRSHGREERYARCRRMLRPWSATLPARAGAA